MCSPELTFVQMATILPIPHLACFGSTLCGIYAKEPLASVRSDGVSESRWGLPRRKQLTTIRDIGAFLDSVPGMTGVKKARVALRMVFERSRSPMETVVALLLSAPLCRGGFALPKPILNCRIDLPSWLHGGIGATGMNAWGELPYAECDMAFFHKGKSVYADFHGGWSHQGEFNVHHDSLRSNAFSQLGMPYYVLTKEQVFNIPLLEKFVSQLRSRLGVYVKTTVSDLPKRQHALHREMIRLVREGRIV